MRYLLGFLFWVGGAAVVTAQTTVVPLLQPWRGPQTLEVDTHAFFFDRTETDDALDSGVDMQWFAQTVRWRADTMDPHAFSLGYAVVQAEIDTNHPALPRRFVDESASLKFFLGESDGWSVDMLLGAGYAGDVPYHDSEAWYALADLSLTRPINEFSMWQVVINYNGNRTFLPDVPLPAILYMNWKDPRLFYTVGLPYCSVRWQADDRLAVSAKLALLYNIQIGATYALGGPDELYLEYDRNLRAIVVDGTDDRRRLFYDIRRIEGGWRRKLGEWGTAVIAAGYGFGQDFSTGWDARDLDEVVELDDAPYLRVGVDLKF